MNTNQQNFEEVTKIALEAIGYKVNKDLLIKGNQIDLFVEKNEPLTTNRFIVECKDYNSNISDKSEEKITNEITSRQKYLESLASGTTGTDATTSSN